LFVFLWLRHLRRCSSRHRSDGVILVRTAIGVNESLDASSLKISFICFCYDKFKEKDKRKGLNTLLRHPTSKAIHVTKCKINARRVTNAYNAV
jgi:hypothetical protein